MKEWWPRILILAALLFVVGVPFLLSSTTGDAASAASASDELVIYSPHNEQIRFEFSRGFNDYLKAQGRPPVRFDWRASGGTSDLRRQVLDQFTAKAKQALAANRGLTGGIGADLFFGGGEYEHNKLAGRYTVSDSLSVEAHRALDAELAAKWKQAGIALTIEIGEAYDLEDDWFVAWIEAGVPTTLVIDTTHAKSMKGMAWEALGATVKFADKAAQREPIRMSKSLSYYPSTRVQISEEKLREVFPLQTIAGEALYHDDPKRNDRLRWVGAALSSFGIVYNNDVLDDYNIEQPTTWSDLTDPAYAGLIALSDPGHSGSIAATYEAILKRKGWTDGWALLREAFANARYFTSSSSKVPIDVSQGDAAAGMCIDFYGRFQAGAVGGNRVGYVDPKFMTATTADPVTILHGSPMNTEEKGRLANEFVLWVLSKDGQRLWQRRLGTPDGPKRFELRRLPVRRDLYVESEMQYWADKVNPFEFAKPFPEAMPGLYGFVAIVSQAMAIDVHDDLRAAWDAMQCEEDENTRRKMFDLFHDMPKELTLTWPSAAIAEQWAEAIADPSHPLHAETTAALKAFTERIYKGWQDAEGLSGDERKHRDRIEWARFFRSNYQKIVALSEQ